MPHLPSRATTNPVPIWNLRLSRLKTDNILTVGLNRVVSGSWNIDSGRGKYIIAARNSFDGRAGRSIAAKGFTVFHSDARGTVC